MAHKIMTDITKVMKCISSSQTPEHIESCKKLINNLIEKYDNYPKKFKSDIIIPYVINMEISIEQKSNIWR